MTVDPQVGAGDDPGGEQRSFPPSFGRSERRAYGAVVALFVAAFVAFLWPVYPTFARVRPLVLGMPASLAYIVAWLLVCFTALLSLYLWEARTGRLDRAEEALEEAARIGRASRAPRFHPPAQATGEKGRAGTGPHDTDAHDSGGDAAGRPRAGPHDGSTPRSPD